MPDTMIKTIQQLWNNAGKTADEIGKQLGKTRSSVMGLIDRARDKGYRFNQRATTRPPAEKHFRTPPKRQAEEARCDRAPVLRVGKQAERGRGSKEITIHELKKTHCKAVVGRSASRNLPTYCGQLRLEGKPYCQEHQQKYKGRS